MANVPNAIKADTHNPLNSNKPGQIRKLGLIAANRPIRIPDIRGCLAFMLSHAPRQINKRNIYICPINNVYQMPVMHKAKITRVGVSGL